MAPVFLGGGRDGDARVEGLGVTRDGERFSVTVVRAVATAGAEH